MCGVSDPLVRLAPIPLYLPAWQVHLLSGPPGGGKTTLATSWVQALRAGLPIFGKPTNQLPWVGSLIADREARDTLSWYETAGITDLPHYSLLDNGDDLNLIRQPLAAHALLRQIVAQLQIPPNGVLILDPISPWCGGDLNRYHVVYPAMMLLGRLCLEQAITIVGLAHTGKQKADTKERYHRPQDRILGSTALLGCSGTQMALVPPDEPGDPTYEFTWVPHHAPAETYELTRAKNGLFLLDQSRQTAAGRLLVPHPEVLALIPHAPDMITKKELIETLAEQKIYLSRAQLTRLLEQYREAKVAYQIGRGIYCRATLQ